MNRYLLCITGASGVIYGYRTLQILSERFEVEAIVSSAGQTVLKEELGKGISDLKREFPSVEFYDERDLCAPVASGSRLTSYGAVLVVPCSTSTLASVACGVNSNLIHRVCEVALKERVKLVMLVREMPYSKIHLENMLRLTEAGAIILPASPGFYHHPKSLEDMIDFVVGKVLDVVGVKHNLYKRWKEG